MCTPGDLLCYGQEALGSVAGAAVSKVTNSALDEIRHSAADMVTTTLKTLGTFWLNIPSPKLGDGTAQNAGVATPLQADLGYFTLLAAVVGLILCGARIGITAKGEHAAEGVKMLVRLIGVTAAGGVVLALLIDAGDAFAPWVIEQATGSTFDQSAPTLLGNEALLSLTPLLTIITGIFAVLGAGAMVIFMIIRGGLLVVLVAVWPLAASLSTTEQGLAWYKKINAWLIAFVLLKPVAAIIYASGFVLLNGAGTFTTDDPTTTALMSTLTGTAVLALAGLSLPAMLRFVSPMTAASGAMSGAAMGAAAVAVGAAVVTGGAGAAAGGASAGGGAAGASAGGGAGAAAGGGAGGGSAGGGASGAAGGGGPTGGGGGGGGPTGGGSPDGGGGPSDGSPGEGSPTPAGAPSGASGSGGSWQEPDSGSGSSGSGPSGSGSSGSGSSGSGSSGSGSSGSGSSGSGSSGSGSSGAGSGASGAGVSSSGPAPASGSGSRWSRGGQVGSGLRTAGRHVNDAATSSIDDSSPAGPSGADTTQNGS